MANTLGAYNEIFYAQQTLLQLRNMLGMGARVDRGYDLERRAREVGDTVTIRQPGNFVAEDAPFNVQDATTKTVDIKLTRHKGVIFEVLDTEAAYTGGDRFIRDHIEPAAYAVGKVIDEDLTGLYTKVPHIYSGATINEDFILAPQEILFDQGVPVDMPNRMKQIINGAGQRAFLGLDIFINQQVAGGAAVDPLMRGTLGTRFNTEIFASQSVASHTPGTLSGGGDVAGTAAAAAANATSITINALTDTQTIKAGDVFTIAGQTQAYSVTADTAVSTTSATVSISPELAVATSGGEVVTFHDFVDTAARPQMMQFHQGAFALAFANLPDNVPNVTSFTAVDEWSGLSLRATVWGDPLNSKQLVKIDALYGVEVINPNFACRAYKTG